MSALARSAVSAETSQWLLRSDRSPRAARSITRSFLDGSPYAGLIDAAELVVSELVTNAVLYGTPSGRRVLLVLRVESGDLRIEVHDYKRDRIPAMRRAGEADEAGRGLQLVKLIASDWGAEERPGGIGKIVWCTITDEEGDES
jgi:anti-sigma regulatory factor (Ser/Thr protein kinase)